MNPILFLSLAVIAQTFPSATQKTGTWSFGTTKSSATHHTGYIPFEVSFPCTFDFVGPVNGCYVNTELDLDAISNGVYPYRGDQPSTDQIHEIRYAEVHLSGVRVSLPGSDGGVSHSTFIPFNEVYVNSEIAWLRKNNVIWFVHANLRDYQPTMYDDFRVWVSGEIVWSDGEASEVASLALSCADTGETCSDTANYSLHHDLSGVALGFLQVAEQTDGIATNMLGVETTITPSSSTTGSITTTCTLGGAAAVSCAFRQVLVAGLSTEMEPFESLPFKHRDNQFWSGGQTDNSSTTYELHREMACGLRSFMLSTPSPSMWGGLQFGATSTDCGFNGANRVDTIPATWDYTGFMKHGFLIDDGNGNPDYYESGFVLDGNKLLWP